MSIRELPPRPNLEHLKNQARTLLDAALAGEAEALSRFAAVGVESPQPKLADALHATAREYGFDTWPALKLHIELGAEDGMAALSSAVKSGKAEAVRDVLARHPELKARIDEPLPDYSFDTTALLGALHRNNREMIDALLDFGANINARSRWWAGGFGVLDMADTQTAEYLISRGATVDIHAAARLGKIERVRELLAGDPQLVHARGGDGELPLHFAATVEIAELLLEHGADINARDIDHESTAAQYMVCQRNLYEWRDPYRHDVARFLIERGSETDILMLSALGDRDRVEVLLDRDPDTIRTAVNERSFPKRDPRSGGIIYFFGFGITKSPHMLAKEFGHEEVLKLLMQRSPLWLRMLNAAELDDQTQIERILATRPSLCYNLPGNSARRIVGVAVRGNARAVETLLSHGWPAGVALENGQTPLHYAAWHGNVAMVESLLRRGAPVNIFEQEHGGSPLAWALHGSEHSWQRETGDYPGVTRALLAAGAKIPQPENMPLQATEELLDILREHAARTGETIVTA